MTERRSDGNLFAGLPAERLAEERFEALLSRPGVRLERIVSTGQASPTEGWYDQGWDEWVVLLAGAATLRFADEESARELAPGDWLLIEAHRRHRVERSAAGQATVWLALHLGGP